MKEMLFYRNSIEKIFEGIEEKAKNEVVGETGRFANVIGIEKTTEMVFDIYKIEAPVFDRKKLSYTISGTQKHDDDLPEDVSLLDDDKWGVKQVTFYVPYKGNKEVFHYSTNSIKWRMVEAEIESKRIVISLRGIGSLNSGNKIIEDLKKTILNDIDYAEEYLACLNKEIEAYFDGLKNRIISWLVDGIKNNDNKSENCSVK